ncbi:hypothetical protein GHR37_27610 [Achromobacter xylosoxidans]|nr:hypothetical protein [Achromobacter xylosoxidans]
MSTQELPAITTYGDDVTAGEDTEQWIRKASLIVGTEDALDLSELRFIFRIKRGDTQTPNTLRVRVYNVSEQTALRTMKEFTRVVLQAGYEGNYGIIFDGTIIQIRLGRENQTDTYVDITAADGDSAYNFGFVNQTLAAGATMRDVVDASMKAMEKKGVTRGYMAFLTEQRLARGKVMFGLARKFMEGVARTTQSVWSIQDGKAVLWPETSYNPGDIPVISPQTGLVGLPEQTSNGITARMLLNPSVKIGTLIQLKNEAIQLYEYNPDIKQQSENGNIEMQSALNDEGLYYVMLAEHWGDTRGNDWYTEVVCLAADVTAFRSFVRQGEVVDPALAIVKTNL